MSIQSVNPATNEVLATFESFSKEEVEAKIAKAASAYSSWKQSTFSERKKLILSFADALEQRVDEFSELITVEMGKRISESKREIKFCAEIARFYANGAEEFLADEQFSKEGAEAYIQHAPLGVLFGVMPWNFPFYQIVRFATPNIMAGNVVMVKQASIVPQCAKAVEDLFLSCGAPEGVYTNLFIPTEFSKFIIEDKRVRGVSLTGSEKAGASVAGLAGENLKRSVLELGGNDPFIVLEDADLDSVVDLAVKGRLVNNGQSCVASKRFIVIKEHAEKFTDSLKQKFESLTLGDPMNEDTDIGPLSSEEAAKGLAAQVKKSIDAGARVVTGGGRPDREGAFFNPTILADISEEMPTFDQELFGPVASIYVVESEQEAIELANNSSFGLGGSVYTKDLERGKRVAEQIESGMVFINQPTKSQSDLPFGGIKNSGYGRELSHLGIMEFINKKLIYCPNEN